MILTSTLWRPSALDTIPQRGKILFPGLPKDVEQVQSEGVWIGRDSASRMRPVRGRRNNPVPFFWEVFAIEASRLQAANATRQCPMPSIDATASILAELAGMGEAELYSPKAPYFPK